MKTRLFAVTLILLAALAASCQSATPLPVDLTRFPSAAEVTNWRHRQTLEADLNGDGKAERVILASDVALDPDSKPLWEDGHRWAVYVADQPDPTLLYAAFVPNGKVEAAVLIADANSKRHILIQERMPFQTRAFVVAYENPGDATTLSESQQQIEQWLPGL